MYRILIIEDDRTIANVLAEHLRTWDYEGALCDEFQECDGRFPGV